MLGDDPFARFHHRHHDDHRADRRAQPDAQPAAEHPESGTHDHQSHEDAVTIGLGDERLAHDICYAGDRHG